MKAANYQWSIQEQSEDGAKLLAFLKELNISEKIAPLLWQRGIHTNEDLQNFLQPSVEQLHDPFSIYNMDKAIERIKQAIESEEKILIYGDYDADGITSTTVMKEALELVGGNVVFYLPNRFTDGYGPNLAVFKRYIEEGITLIVTVDNGVAGHEPIAYAQDHQVDVIVTDHHELPEELPNAFAIVHPRHPQGDYPFGDLAGVGVAFKVATALLGEIPYELLDLVAIGTIADLVSLTHENRVLVKLGLSVLAQSDRPGLKALCKEAGIIMGKVTAENIGFAIAPRLNAVGRLGDASPGVELLSTFSEEEAETLAKFVQEQNEERQALVKTITTEALEMIQIEKQEHGMNILAKENWHEGVLGIVASRIVQETGKPTIVLTIDPATQQAKGSGRSVDIFNLYEVLSAQKELFKRFGGHHMAAGMTIAVENIDKLQIYVDQFILENQLDFTVGQQLQIDETLKIEEITTEFIQAVQLLAPFGTDNQAPAFMIEGREIKELKQIGSEKTHLKFQAVESNVPLDCIAFGKGSDLSEFQYATTYQLVGQLSINEWNGRKKPQMMITDYQILGTQVFDYRGGRAKELPDLGENTVYLLFDEKNKKIIENRNNKTVLSASELNKLVTALPEIQDQLVIIDCPVTIAELKAALAQTHFSRIYLQCYSKEECYLNGMPTRRQFGALFKFIEGNKNIDVRYKIKAIAQHLKLAESLLIFMIQVFFELKFVTIEDGVMNKVTTVENQSLEESEAFQKRQARIKTEEFLLYSDIKVIQSWIAQQEEEQ